MKVTATRGIWLPVRWIILVSVGGGALAAVPSWMTFSRIEQCRLDKPFTTVIGTERDQAYAALPAESATVRGIQSSITRWTDRSLFLQPSQGWTLDAEQRASMPLSESQSTFAWVTQQGSDSFAAAGRTDYWQPASLSSEFVGRAGPASPNAPTGTNGMWIQNGFGLWSSSSNWAGGVIADGVFADARFDLFDLTFDATVVLDTSRTIGFLGVGDTNLTNHYAIIPDSGSTLTFDTGAMTRPDLSQIRTSAGDSITPQIFFKGDFNINNFSTTNAFTIAGGIESSATNTFQTIYFNPLPSSGGQINITGKLANGSTGSTVRVEVDAGLVIFSANNNYTGGTAVAGGTLLVNGNDTAATGNVQVSGNGSVLGGTGTVGGQVLMFDGTITGGTTTTVGTLTLKNNLFIDTGEGPGGTYLANLSGATSDLLAIGGSLILGFGSHLEIDGTADNVTTYILATFSGGRADIFGSVSGVPDGYSLVYHDTDIELVPIPEPATWIGGGLALAALAFASRKRSRQTLKS